MKKTTKWDAFKYLESEVNVAACLNTLLKNECMFVIVTTFDDVACAKRMIHLVKETSTTCDDLYKALSPIGNLSFDTIQKIIKSFGLKPNTIVVS